jgi:cold shock CspA family protein
LKREKKRKEKEAKKLARAENKNSLDDDSMIAYVDEFGNITDTPPDLAAREEINAEDIELGIPKKEKIDTDEVRTGFVSFFNDVKQFGFIRDASTQESIFVHASNTKEPIKENMKVRFEVEKSPRGLSAINVESEKG